jgi:hypothetical protein
MDDRVQRGALRSGQLVRSEGAVRSAVGVHPMPTLVVDDFAHLAREVIFRTRR